MKNATKDILRLAGFEKEIERVECGICPLCGLPVDKNELEDRASLKEFEISGMCQKCQNSLFE